MKGSVQEKLGSPMSPSAATDSGTQLSPELVTLWLLTTYAVFLQVIVL